MIILIEQTLLLTDGKKGKIGFWDLIKIDHINW